MRLNTLNGWHGGRHGSEAQLFGDFLERCWLDGDKPGLCYDPIITPTLVAVGVEAATAATVSSIAVPVLGVASTIGGTLLQANAQADQADYQQKLLNAESLSLHQKANEDAAAAQRVQITQNRRTDLALSRAQAVGAASGTDATSPDIINTEGEIAQQGAYNAQSALYEGQAKARTSNYQADIDLFQARRVQQALPFQQAGTVLSGISSFGKLFTPGRNYYGGL